MKEWLKTDEAFDIEVKVRRNEFWQESCLGTVEQWFFETLNYYPYDHFLTKTNLNTMFNYKGFNDLPAKPQVKALVGKNHKFPIYETDIICGTVISKNNVKKTATILTTSGVAICRLGDELFSKYNQTIKNGDVKEDSWFNRGTNFVLLGTRNGTVFRVKRVKNATSVMKIVNQGYKIKLQKR